MHVVDWSPAHLAVTAECMNNPCLREKNFVYLHADNLRKMFNQPNEHKEPRTWLNDVTILLATEWRVLKDIDF